MADKSINELPVSPAMTDDALLVVYQNGETDSIRGALIKQYARESVEPYKDAAEKSARDAAASANAAKESEDAAAASAGQTAADVAVVKSAADEERARQEAETKRVAAESSRAQAETQRADEETARDTAEKKRIEDENARLNAEQARAAAETARASEETTRQQNESARVSSETQRRKDESARKSEEEKRIAAEQGRVSAETERAASETARGTAEASRAAEETKRTAAETARASAETGRATEEGKRVTAESARKTAEDARAAAETARASEEMGRVQVEKARAEAETARTAAETGRAAAETARADAEAARRVFAAYDAATQYHVGNKVAFDGSTYYCVADCKGTPPPDADCWALMAGRGQPGGGTLTCRFVVGTSAAGWNANECDYLCDGIDDQIEINAAIQALPDGGGSIILLDGTYNITAPVLINKSGVTLSGCAGASILRRQFRSTKSEGMLALSADCIQIRGLRFNVFDTFQSAYSYMILAERASHNAICDNLFYGGGQCIGCISGQNNAINNNIFWYTANTAITLEQSSHNTISGNAMKMVQSGVINLKNQSNFNVVTGNTFSDCFNVVLSLNNSHNNNLSGNAFQSSSAITRYVSAWMSDKNVFTGNVFGKCGTCMDFYQSCNNTICGNLLNEAEIGILLQSSSDGNGITGNTLIRGSGTTSDYTAEQHTIWLQGTDCANNLIYGNLIRGKDCTVDGGTGNTIGNNKYS